MRKTTVIRRAASLSAFEALGLMIDLLEERGWVQGTYALWPEGDLSLDLDRAVGLSLLAALDLVAPDFLTRRAVIDRLRGLFPFRASCLTEFNDLSCVRASHVFEVLLEAQREESLS